MAGKIPHPPSAPSTAWWAMRVTYAGWIYLGLTIFVLLAAVNSGANLLYFLFGLFVGAWLVSAILSWINLRGITLHRDLPDHALAGEPTEIRYAFTSIRRRSPAISLFFRELHPQLAQAPAGFITHLPPARREAAASVVIPAPLVPLHRGMLQLRTVELSTTFPFGFLRRRARLNVPQQLLVYPRIGTLARSLTLQYRDNVESGSVLARKRGGQEEFFGIREYRPGDNLRSIHWRSSARTGQIMIREPASTTPPQLMVILNLRTWQQTPAGRDFAEQAIELAGALICWGFYENFAVGLGIAGLPDETAAIPRMGWDARALLLERLAQLNLDHLSNHPVEIPGRIAGKIQTIVVTLRSADPVADLITTPTTPRAAPTPSLLALDAPGAADWIRFLDPHQTHRLLRTRTTPKPPNRNPNPLYHTPPSPPTPSAGAIDATPRPAFRVLRFAF